MKDTTFTPSPDQCRRLMVAEKGASPCNNTLAAMGSGGVYSTPGDMMRWMQQYLSSDFYHRSQQADRMQTLIYQRTQLTKVVGMDVPGRADALGLGWVYMAPKNGRPGIIQKTGRRRWLHYLYGDDPTAKRWGICRSDALSADPFYQYERRYQRTGCRIERVQATGHSCILIQYSKGKRLMHTSLPLFISM